MVTCDICFYEMGRDELFILQCCKNNSMCLKCLDLLTKSLCPFCRTPFEYDKPRISRSYEEPLSWVSSHDQYFFTDPYTPINPYDDYYTDSRILRRAIKRLRKLQERELHNSRNRDLNRAINSSIRSERTFLQKMVTEGIEIYHLEKDTV